MYTDSASVCCTAAVVVIEAAYADDTAADVEVVVLEEVTEVITAAEVTEVSVASSVEVIRCRSRGLSSSGQQYQYAHSSSCQFFEFRKKRSFASLL